MDTTKFLIAVDASDNALRAVTYTGDVLGALLPSSGEVPFKVTLLYIERLPDRDYYTDEAAWKESCETHRRDMRDFLAQAGQLLKDKGLPESAVDVQYLDSCSSPFLSEGAACSRGTSIAQEILRYLQAGEYGTAVVGRRGVSKAEEFLFGSVSSKIIHCARDCTVWVVA